MFSLRMNRCVDPSDLGSYASALRCTACMKKSPNMVGSILACKEDPDLWRCEKCNTKFSTSNIQNLVFKISEDVQQIVDSSSVDVIDQAERALKKYRFVRML